MTFALRPRDRTEKHRVATPLELFTDLGYVVAVAQAATRLYHPELTHTVAPGGVGEAV